MNHFRGGGGEALQFSFPWEARLLAPLLHIIFDFNFQQLRQPSVGVLQS